MQFISPTLNSLFNCHNPSGINLITRLCTDLSHLPEHKFKRSFQDSLNPICCFSTDVESCVLIFLHCFLFRNERLILLKIVKNINSKIKDYSALHLIQILFFCGTSLVVNTNLFCIIFSLYWWYFLGHYFHGTWWLYF